MSDDIPHWAKVRACELANAETGINVPWPEGYRLGDVEGGLTFSWPLRALARYIAQHEPVDHDLVLAREAAAECALLVDAHSILAGGQDDCRPVKAALRAIKLLRERGL